MAYDHTFAMPWVYTASLAGACALVAMVLWSIVKTALGNSKYRHLPHLQSKGFGVLVMNVCIDTWGLRRRRDDGSNVVCSSADF